MNVALDRPPSMYMRMETALKQLHAAAKESGWREDYPVMKEALGVLEELQRSRISPPAEAGVESFTAGTWHGEYLQGDQGASLAICARGDGVLAIVPPADGRGDTENQGAAQVPREAYDLANFRRILACANFCEGIPTHELEAHRPDVKPFIDNCGRQFVIYSSEEFDGSDGRGFWSGDIVPLPGIYQVINGDWTTLEDATRFTQSETGQISFPAMADAKWMHVTEAEAELQQVLALSGGAKP